MCFLRNACAALFFWVLSLPLSVLAVEECQACGWPWTPVVPAQGTTTNLRGCSHASGQRIQRHQCVNERPPTLLSFTGRPGNHKLYCWFCVCERQTLCLDMSGGSKNESDSGRPDQLLLLILRGVLVWRSSELVNSIFMQCLYPSGTKKLARRLSRVYWMHHYSSENTSEAPPQWSDILFHSCHSEVLWIKAEVRRQQNSLEHFFSSLGFVSEKKPPSQTPSLCPKPLPQSRSAPY